MSSGIAAWGTYLPFWRLQRSAIAGVLGSGGGQGDPRRGLPRRGHHHAGRGGRAAGLGGRPGRGVGAGPLPLHAGPRVPRQDERHDGARRARPGAWLRRRTTSPGRRARRWGRCCRGSEPPARGGGARPHHAGRPLRPAHRSGRLGRGARQRRRRGGLRVRARGSRRRAGRAAAPRATSSSTAGACRARRTRTSGRSASARSSTCRWPGRPSRRR